MKQQSILPCLKRMATDQHQEQPAEGQPAKQQAKFSSFFVSKKLAKPSLQQDDPPSLPPSLQQDDPLQFTFNQMTTDPLIGQSDGGMAYQPRRHARLVRRE
jgi:hypothetical protein